MSGNRKGRIRLRTESYGLGRQHQPIAECITDDGEVIDLQNVTKMKIDADHKSVSAEVHLARAAADIEIDDVVVVPGVPE